MVRCNRRVDLGGFNINLKVLAIKKKSILGFNFSDFDSYVNFRNFGWRTL